SRPAGTTNSAPPRATTSSRGRYRRANPGGKDAFAACRHSTFPSTNASQFGGIRMDTKVPAASGSRRLRGLAAAAVFAAVFSMAPASAHFVLESPAPTLEQNAIGDPQKLGPCGGTSQDAGTPTGAVTELTGGSTLHLKLREAVYHPGHYRVALARTAAG